MLSTIFKENEESKKWKMEQKGVTNSKIFNKITGAKNEYNK